MRENHSVARVNILFSECMKIKEQTIQAISNNIARSHRFDLVNDSLSLLFKGTCIRDGNMDADQGTLGLLGVRMFNCGTASLELALTGFHQQALSLVRDIMETGFPTDYFASFPGSIKTWREADQKLLKKKFSPPGIRKELDKRDNVTSQARGQQYSILCRMAAHVTPSSFALNVDGNNAD